MFSQLSAESAPISDFKHSGITLVHSSHFKFCSRVASRHRAAGGLPLPAPSSPPAMRRRRHYVSDPAELAAPFRIRSINIARRTIRVSLWWPLVIIRVVTRDRHTRHGQMPVNYYQYPG